MSRDTLSRGTRLPFRVIPDWIYDLGPQPERVYGALARFADRDGVCFPSVAAIARTSGFGTTTVRNAIERLVEAGALERRSRTNQNGGDTSAEYVLHEVATPLRDTEPPPPPDGGPPSATRRASTFNDNHVNDSATSPSGTPHRARGALVAAQGIELMPVDEGVGATTVVIAGLCDQLASHVGTLTARRAPPVQKKWIQQMRLLLDTDGASEAQVAFVIRWLGSNTTKAMFWSQNVQCPATLRRQWGKLVAAIKAERTPVTIIPADAPMSWSEKNAAAILIAGGMHPSTGGSNGHHGVDAARSVAAAHLPPGLVRS